MKQPISQIKRVPIKIFHLINDLGYGGAPHTLFNLLEGIDKTRFTPVVGLWGSFYGSEMIEKFRLIGIKVIDFKARKKFDLHSLFKIYKYLSTNSIPIIHTHLFLMHIMGRIAGKAAGTPGIISTHHNLKKSNNLVSRFFEKITSPISDVTISVSRAAEETYFPSSVPFTVRNFCAGQRHFTIYNGVDSQKIDQTLRAVNIEQVKSEFGLESEHIFTCVGRLHPSKGHRYLIEAAGHLKRTHPSFKLLIVGDGILKGELLQLISSKGLSEHIRFLGYRKDVYRILAVSNALVQPSIFEGFGLAAAEAMACGLPVISTNLPSIAEVVRHEETGILVPPADPWALSTVMARLMDHPKLATAYGANGRRRVEKLFSNNVITKQYETLYRMLIE